MNQDETKRPDAAGGRLRYVAIYNLQTRPEQLPRKMLQMWVLAAVALSLAVTHLVRTRYARSINRFNGPLLASFTDAWRMYYYCSNQKVPFQELHDHYGEVVRIGPNALSFSSPQAIPEIFGPGKNWQKVCSCESVTSI